MGSPSTSLKCPPCGEEMGGHELRHVSPASPRQSVLFGPLSQRRSPTPALASGGGRVSLTLLLPQYQGWGRQRLVILGCPAPFQDRARCRGAQREGELGRQGSSPLSTSRMLMLGGGGLQRLQVPPGTGG
ncbi:hypothetical protein HJG60_008820 [Phyllostomus discolor]|uniref:Uncharacterized protein n=1 Tax=Phyllostomus discolor TaxID=89673 RepID=A0A833YU40_9CHIR|nr:hypothetical protein HJG60_008820 [Phyllostomus discolor]